MATNGRANGHADGASGRPDRAKIAADLRALLKHSEVVDAPAELQTYAYDASFLTQLEPDPARRRRHRALDGGRRRPCMRYADEHGIPVTPRGAASGQTAGSVAVEGGIVLALNAMNRVLEVDLPNMQVICEPGVVHAKLNEQLGQHRLIFPPDPGSTRMATVGGMASTNAHGMRAVKYGPTSAWVLGLEVVLPNGEVIETGSVGSRAKQSSAGLELTKLFVGAEGIARRHHAAAPQADADPARAGDRAGACSTCWRTPARPSRPSSAAGSARRPSRSWTSAASRRSTSTARRWACPRPRRCSSSRSTATRPACAGTPRRSPSWSRRWRRSVDWSDEPKRIAALWEARSVVGAAVGRAAAGLEPGLLRRGPLRAGRRASPRRCGRSRTSARSTTSRSRPTATSAAAASTPAT